MSNIVLDTHVFIRLTTDYSFLLDCISSIGDFIIFSPECRREYEGRTPSYLIFQVYLDRIRQKCLMYEIPQSRVNSKFKRHCNQRKVKLPSHKKDHKWIKVAISEHAEYILSKDGHLTSVPVFKTNNSKCEVIYPKEYVDRKCPYLPVKIKMFLQEIKSELYE